MGAPSSMRFFGTSENAKMVEYKQIVEEQETHASNYKNWRDENPAFAPKYERVNSAYLSSKANLLKAFELCSVNLDEQLVKEVKGDISNFIKQIENNFLFIPAPGTVDELENILIPLFTSACKHLEIVNPAAKQRKINPYLEEKQKLTDTLSPEKSKQQFLDSVNAAKKYFQPSVKKRILGALLMFAGAILSLCTCCRVAKAGFNLFTNRHHEPHLNGVTNFHNSIESIEIAVNFSR